MKAKFKDLFTSLETSKKFQEMGLFQESNFVWWYRGYDKEYFIRQRDTNYFGETIIAPAPTTDEVLVELPSIVKHENRICQFRIVKEQLDYYSVGYWSDTTYIQTNSTRPLIDLLAELYIKLKEEKVI